MGMLRQFAAGLGRSGLAGQKPHPYHDIKLVFNLPDFGQLSVYAMRKNLEIAYWYLYRLLLEKKFGEKEDSERCSPLAVLFLAILSIFQDLLTYVRIKH